MADALAKPPRNALYDRDFFAWTQQQATLLRERRFADLDCDTLAEEVAGVGRSDKREIRSRLTVLLVHLLKWMHQPERRGASWRRTIMEQRQSLAELAADSPSLAAYPETVFQTAYLAATVIAADETGLPPEVFADQPSFSLADSLAEGYWPEPSPHP